MQLGGRNRPGKVRQFRPVQLFLSVCVSFHMLCSSVYKPLSSPQAFVQLHHIVCQTIPRTVLLSRARARNVVPVVHDLDLRLNKNITGRVQC